MNTCVIEALYPEVCNLFGDTGNLRYLKLCLPQATFIETALNDEPYFVHHPVSMIYLGPMSEHTQCTVKTVHHVPCGGQVKQSKPCCNTRLCIGDLLSENLHCCLSCKAGRFSG